MANHFANRWRNYQKKVNTDECYKVRREDFARWGILPLDESDTILQATIRWVWRDNEYGSFDVIAHRRPDVAGGHLLRFKGELGGIPFDYTISTDYTPRRRWYWFLCPGCGSRCGVLYLPRRSHPVFTSQVPHRFGCRECHQIVYASSQNTRKYPPSLADDYRRTWYAL